METDEESYWKDGVVCNPTTTRPATFFTSPSARRPRAVPSISAPVPYRIPDDNRRGQAKGRASISASLIHTQVASSDDEPANISSISSRLPRARATTKSRTNRQRKIGKTVSNSSDESDNEKEHGYSPNSSRRPIQQMRPEEEESDGSAYLSSSPTLAQTPSPAISESSLSRTVASTLAPLRELPRQENLPSDTGAQAFMKRLFTVNNLPRSIIAHNRNLQHLFDTKLVCWGVQWEVYRGLNLGHWTEEDVERHIEQLRGTHANVMPLVGHILGKPDRTAVDEKLAAELDRENAAQMENRERGLGLMGAFEGVPDWCGGKVQFVVRLVQASPELKFEMEPPEMLKSTRLARDLGSRRILHARIGEKLLRSDREGVIKALEKKFVIGGRVFLALPPKDDSMTLIEDTEDFQRVPRRQFGDHLRLSYGEVLDRYNPMALNSRQPLLKFFARYALALSTSVPAIEFLDENIIFIEDDVAPDWTGPGKPPAEKTLTDGCGFMNKSALVAIALRFKIPFPTAVQGRIAGSKGLWILHPTDGSPIPKIWIRQSQLKVQLPRPLRRGERILDLVQTSSGQTVLSTMHLSMQSIMNLSHNGVPNEVFIKLSADGLNAATAPLMDWSTPFALARAWQAVTRLGSVGGIRMSRMAAGMSRVLGYSGRPISNPDTQASADPGEQSEASLSTGRNDLSGAPLTAYETVMELIQSGFNPRELPTLWTKLRQIMVWTINDAIENYKIPLPDGTAGKAFAIADPFGRLREDEIYYRVSGGFQDDMLRTRHVVVGEVLTGRYPIRHPSDIQRVTAVDYPEYAEYSDVVIVPSRCSKRHAVDGFGLRSFMSILGGGDLDGDELFVIWEPSLVQPFCNKPVTTEPVDFKRDNFESSIEQVQQFMERAEKTTTAQLEFMQTLLRGFTDGLVGRYSVYHDISIWKRGYDHQETTRLAFMSNTLLDAGKTGVRVRKAVRDKDFKVPMARPHCMNPSLFSTSSAGPSHCSRYGKKFVLEAIQDAGKALSDEMQVRYDESLKGGKQERPDSNLLLPYNTLAESGVTPILDVLALVRNHVEASLAQWRSAVGVTSSNNSISRNAQRHQTPRTPSASNTKKQQAFDAVTAQFRSPIPGATWLPNVETVKASYAYQLQANFAFSVAFRELCKIKAEAAGLAPSTRMFDDLRSSMPGSARRLLEQGITYVAEPTI